MLGGSRIAGPLIPTRSFSPAIVITGASSGIGQDLALSLAEEGYTVFAGVRREADGFRLAALAGSCGVLYPILLDVTKEDSLVTAAQTVREWLDAPNTSEPNSRATSPTPSPSKSRSVEKRPKMLAAVIANAGVPGDGLPLELTSLQDLDRIWQVNVFGVQSTLRNFASLIRECSSRVLVISSAAANVHFPRAGTYNGSKRAVEGLVDSFRTEMQDLRLGISVSIIEPGSISTPNWQKGTLARKELEKQKTELNPEVSSIYFKPSQAVVQGSRAIAQANASPCEVVTDSVMHALQDLYPLNRYWVGWDAKVAGMLTWILPSPIVDYILRIMQWS